MSRTPLHDVAVVGACNSRQARVLEGETSLSITMEAVRGALADAGIGPGEVDGISIVSGYSGGHIPQQWVRFFGGNPCWTGNTGMTGIQGVLEAAAAIAAGLCHTAIVANGQAGAYTARESTAPWTRP